MLCVHVSTVKNHSKFVINFSASQPPTTLPPPTTEAIETTTQRRVVNFIQPIGHTTMLYTVNMLDKGTLISRVHPIIVVLFLNLKNNCGISGIVTTLHFKHFIFSPREGTKYHATFNEIDKSGGDQKFTDSSKSVDWTNKNDVSNKGD